MLSDKENPPNVRYSGRRHAALEAIDRVSDLIEADRIPAFLSGFSDEYINRMERAFKLLNRAIIILDPELDEADENPENGTQQLPIDEQLKRVGLRRACDDETGCWYPVFTAEGYEVQIPATHYEGGEEDLSEAEIETIDTQLKRAGLKRADACTPGGHWYTVDTVGSSIEIFVIDADEPD